MISRPVPLPLRPILWSTNAEGVAVPSCDCSKGEDCRQIGKHSALYTYTDLKYGDPVQRPDEGCGTAIRTGTHPKGSDVIVIDLDGAEAIDTFMRMHEASGEPDIDTRIVETGRADGGMQLYFQLEPGVHIKNSMSAIAPNIDVRGEVGIAVMEGSPHKSSPDARYKLLTGTTPPAQMPRWLAAWFAERDSGSGEIQTYEGDVSDPVERAYRRELYRTYLETTDEIRSEKNRGKGDKLLFDVIQYGAFDLRLPTEDIIDDLRDVYDPRNDRPWGDELEERVLHKAHDAKTSSTRARVEPAPNPAVHPELAAILSATVVADPRELDLGMIEAFDHARIEGKAMAAPDGLGFTFGDWDSEPPPTDFLVDGLVPAGSIGVVFGNANSLKTWLMYSMAISIARGVPWLGRATKSGGMKVGIVDYETGSNNLRKRLFMLRAGREEKLGAVPFPRGEKPNDRAFWVRLAKDDCDLVIIDSLRRANPGANENDNAEAILPLELASEFSELVEKMGRSCAVIFIHHAKKAADDGWPQYRGASAIEDQVDYAYAVRKIGGNGDSEGARRVVEIRCDKAGDFKSPEKFAVEIIFDDVARTATVSPTTITGGGQSTGPGTYAAAGPEMDENEIQKRITFALSNGPILTKKKILERTTGRSASVYAEIDAMKNGGKLVFIKDVGFDLDSPERRRARIFAQATKRDRWKSAAEIAGAATVPTYFVEEMVRDGLLVQRIASGPGAPGGYIVPVAS